MRKLLVFLSFVCLMQMAFAQDKNQDVNMVSHSVQLGETVRMLSKKYLVDPSEIYRYNKFAVDGIRQGMVLQIPVPVKEAPVEQQESVTDNSREAPSEVQAPIQEAQAVTASTPEPAVNKSKAVTVIDRDNETEHTVQSGETLYALSRKYGVPVDEIKLSNPDLGKGIKVGQVVKIPSVKEAPASQGVLGSNAATSGATHSSTAVSDAPARSENAAAVENTAAEGPITHEVLAGETLFSLAKRYQVSVDAIKSQNPSIAKRGLQVGQKINIGYH